MVQATVVQCLPARGVDARDDQMMPRFRCPVQEIDGCIFCSNINVLNLSFQCPSNQCRAHSRLFLAFSIDDLLLLRPLLIEGKQLLKKQKKKVFSIDLR